MRISVWRLLAVVIPGPPALKTPARRPLMIPRPIESLRIARKRVPKPAFSVVAAAGMVVDVIAYPLPMRAVYWQIPNVLGQTSHSAKNDAQAAFTDHFWGKEGISVLTFFMDEEGQGLV